MADTTLESEDAPVEHRGNRWWLLLLIVPYAALCFPKVYTRLTPAIWGFPFFYWYQFAWVLITSALLGLVIRTTRR